MAARTVLLPFDETQWIIRVRQILNEEIELCDDEPISVFDVPKPLLCTKPEAYIPQLVSLGPYHHCREELGDMERHKLSAAKRAQVHLPAGVDLQQLVDGFIKSEHRIRCHYHRHLNLSNEALAWMMAIDVSFLLEFLETFISTTDNTNKRPAIPSRRTSRLADPSRRTSSSRSMLLRDVVMLENQVPLFLLVKALERRCAASSSSTTTTTRPDARSVLSSMLIGFFHEVSTFRGLGRPCTDADRHLHLLDFLYSNMVPSARCADRQSDDGEAQEEEEEEEESRCNKHDRRRKMRTLVSSVRDVFVKRGSKLVSVLTGFTVRVLVRFVASLPCLAVLSQPIEELTQQHQASEPHASDAEKNKQNLSSSPLLEEIAVPSVTELAYAGVRFCPTVGDLSAISFSTGTATLHLPVIGVDANSEVVLRNLVAYEASGGGRPLALARYVELMNGIVDTEEDARLLRECGVTLNYLRSDAEVAELWNGMTRSVRLTRVPALDRVIDDLNRHYGGCWKVKVRTFVRVRVLLGCGRELLGCVAVVTLLLFMGIQVFCIVARGYCVPAPYRMPSRKVGPQ